jgi:hypothetical protein
MLKLRWAFVAAAAIVLSWQLFVPPIVGLADQGDFARVIGLFGYGPADKTTEYAYVAGKYVPDPSSRLRVYEQATTEYIFAGAAVLFNKLISHDGTLDIRVIGFVHLIAFLYAFHRLLAATPVAIWPLALLILTDVGYAAYWNSFYAEPASFIFFLLLLAESITICRAGEVTTAQAIRWSVWAFLWVFAKPVNTPEGILLALFAFRILPVRRIAIGGALLIASAAAINMTTIPTPNTWPTVYDQIFLAILPESRDPAADARELGLPEDWLKYTGTGAWSQGTNLYQGVVTGLIGKKITNGAIARFYLRHPGRIWRRAKRILPVAYSLRPEWCGNYERSADKPAGARSESFDVWAGFHEHWLGPVGKPILIALMIAPFASITAWICWPGRRRFIEFYGLLGLACLMAFVVAITGDAWDNVKHLVLFNLLLDTWLVAGIAFVFQWTRKVLHGI